MRKDVVGARDEVITLVEAKREIAREEGGLELKEHGVPLEVRIPTHSNAVLALLNSGLATPPGHCSVSIATCMIKSKSTGPSHEPCRTPVVLSTSKPHSQILTLTLAPKRSRIKTLTKWSGRPNHSSTVKTVSKASTRSINNAHVTSPCSFRLGSPTKVVNNPPITPRFH
jgi:hypothetical protein